MNEDATKKLTADEKLDLILSEIGQMKMSIQSLDVRHAALEERVEERLKDTRPIWQAIHAQTEKLVQQYAQLDERLGRVEEQNVQLIQQNVQFDERLSRVEEQNAQLIQQNVQFDARLGRIEEKIEDLSEGIGVLSHDVIEVRAAQQSLKKRVAALEQKVA